MAAHFLCKFLTTKMTSKRSSWMGRPIAVLLVLLLLSYLVQASVVRTHDNRYCLGILNFNL
jgi:hypothetical protein